MQQVLLITEFRAELRHRADKHFKGSIGQAFVSWYVEAVFQMQALMGILKWMCS
jgi:hypothetical protein